MNPDSAIQKFEDALLEATEKCLLSKRGWNLYSSIWGNVRYSDKSQRYKATYGSPFVCLLIAQRKVDVVDPFLEGTMVRVLASKHNVDYDFVCGVVCDYRSFHSPSRQIDDNANAFALGKRLRAVTNGLLKR